MPTHTYHNFLLHAPVVQYATESNLSIITLTSIENNDCCAFVLSITLDSIVMQKILESSEDVIRVSRTSVSTFGTLRMVLAKMER